MQLLLFSLTRLRLTCHRSYTLHGSHCAQISAVYQTPIMALLIIAGRSVKRQASSVKRQAGASLVWGTGVHVLFNLSEWEDRVSLVPSTTWLKYSSVLWKISDQLPQLTNFVRLLWYVFICFITPFHTIWFFHTMPSCLHIVYIICSIGDHGPLPRPPPTPTHPRVHRIVWCRCFKTKRSPWCQANAYYYCLLLLFS